MLDVIAGPRVQILEVIYSTLFAYLRIMGEVLRLISFGLHEENSFYQWRPSNSFDTDHVRLADVRLRQFANEGYIEKVPS